MEAVRHLLVPHTRSVVEHGDDELARIKDPRTRRWVAYNDHRKRLWFWFQRKAVP